MRVAYTRRQSSPGLEDPLSDYLALDQRTEEVARDQLFRSGLRQVREILEAARACRGLPGRHAELLTIAGDMRRFAVRRSGRVLS